MQCYTHFHLVSGTEAKRHGTGAELHRSRQSTLSSAIPAGNPGVELVSFRDGLMSPCVVGKAAPLTSEIHLGVSKL